MPAKKTSTAKKPGRGKKQIGLTSALGPKATTILVICVMAGGIAIAARQKEQAAKAKAAEEVVMTADAAPADIAAAPRKTKAKGPATAVTTEPAPRAAATSGTVAKTEATITGCLERDGDAFRLKNVEGEDAPKSRSWKSGFLKKGSASVTVVDSSRSLRLASQVGRRVSVSGTLANRELRAAAIHQVAPSCKAN